MWRVHVYLGRQAPRHEGLEQAKGHAHSEVDGPCGQLAKSVWVAAYQQLQQPLRGPAPPMHASGQLALRHSMVVGTT